MSRGDVGVPYREAPRMSAAERIVWTCVGVTVYVFLAGFVIRVIRTVAAFHGAGA